MSCHCERSEAISPIRNFEIASSVAEATSSQ
jgi:hypothetical protein